MYRKYFTEFGLNLYTSYKAFMPMEAVYNYKDEHNYNIYLIAYSPRVYLKSIRVTDKNQYLLKFHYDVSSDNQEYYVVLDNLFLDIPPKNTHFEIVDDGEAVRVYIDEACFHGALRRFSAQFRMESKNGYCCVKIEAGTFFYKHCPIKEVYFDVLYIGQSQGRTGNRGAQERLKSHTKLQEILTDFYATRRSERLFAFLFEVDVLHQISIDGINSKHLAERPEEIENFNLHMDHEHQNRQVINLFEAALINYLKPPYNEKLINNFPNKSSKGYADYFSLDYNNLTVEVDVEFDMKSMLVLRTETAALDEFNRAFSYRLDNNPNRLDMFEIFKETPDDI